MNGPVNGPVNGPESPAGTSWVRMVDGPTGVDFMVERTIDERFRLFHDANPHVYTELVALARQAHRRGYRRIGIELLFSALRWRRMMSTTADEYGFKLNDHFTSRYARLIMAREPDLVGLFAVRTLRAR